MIAILAATAALIAAAAGAAIATRLVLAMDLSN